jgi:hypothetical protein
MLCLNKPFDFVTFAGNAKAAIPSVGATTAAAPLPSTVKLKRGAAAVSPVAKNRDHVDPKITRATDGSQELSQGVPESPKGRTKRSK